MLIMQNREIRRIKLLMLGKMILSFLSNVKISWILLFRLKKIWHTGFECEIFPHQYPERKILLRIFE